MSKNSLFERNVNQKILKRILEPRRFIQVIIGPRQVGKTTAVNQVLQKLNLPHHYASADKPTLESQSWIEQQWQIGRAKTKDGNDAVLVIDEIQKVTNWSSIVKALWDEDTRNQIPLRVILLGSSPLLMQSGLSESLAGRFEIVPVSHWDYNECHQYFGWDVDTYIYFGGYPGAASLIHDEKRWANYIQDSLIETTISRDILLMTRVNKPALLRRLFYLGCEYSGQILSYQKMLGQLQDAGNTTTLAHYLELLSGAGLLAGLSKFSGKAVRKRGSSPKLQVYNTALMSAQNRLSFSEAKNTFDYWGRLVESAIGAYLLNLAFAKEIELYYWRDGNYEVDFVVSLGQKLLTIEVKSNNSRKSISGLSVFSKAFDVHRKILVGADGIPVADFLKSKPHDWLL